ncbi:hypothetical protein GCM10028822_17280 [Hymenobacter terrigena]
MPIEFPAYTRRAIALVANSNGHLEDEEVVNLFCANSIPRDEAIELLLFLPDAFCRHMLPQVDWPSYYVEFVSQEKQIQIQYSDNPRFLAIKEAMTSYLAGDFKQADFLKIASRSASFKALNQLLIAGGKLENADIAPEYIVR